MSTSERLERYSQAFKLGILLAILEYDGALEPVVEQDYLDPSRARETLSRFNEAIYRMYKMGNKQTIEDLLLSIGDVPCTLEDEQYQELLAGYKTECIFQVPYPGYLPRKCKPFSPPDD